MPSHETLLLLSLPPEQSIDGLDFHQLVYVRFLAYQINTDCFIILYFLLFIIYLFLVPQGQVCDDNLFPSNFLPLTS
jgi:hypothetical protein